MVVVVVASLSVHVDYSSTVVDAFHVDDARSPTASKGGIPLKPPSAGRSLIFELQSL